MKRRMWIRENDIVLVSPWDFDPKRADIVWRYIKDHADWLENNGYMRPTGPAAAAAQPATPAAAQPSQTAAATPPPQQA
jgi:hypothetical protein